MYGETSLVNIPEESSVAGCSLDSGIECKCGPDIGFLPFCETADSGFLEEA